MRRTLCAIIVGVMLALPAGAAIGQDRPALKLVVGFPAGAALDTLSRLIAEKMKVALNRPVIVENKAGAGGAVAAEFVKSAAPDANTVLVSPVANISIAPHSNPNLRFTAPDPVALPTVVLGEPNTG